jgi:ferredoxin
MRIIVDHDLCEHNAVCVSWAPEVFGLDEQNGTMKMLDETPGRELTDKVREAVSHCPRGAISVVDD